VLEALDLQPSTVARLARSLDIDRSSASRAVQRLVLRGLASRRAISGRTFVVRPTRDGRRLVGRMRAAQIAALRRFVEPLLEPTTDAMVAGLHAFAHALGSELRTDRGHHDVGASAEPYGLP
jgi:DNA-binding MarR family transcriptional regulator